MRCSALTSAQNQIFAISWDGKTVHPVCMCLMNSQFFRKIAWEAHIGLYQPSGFFQTALRLFNKKAELESLGPSSSSTRPALELLVLIECAFEPLLCEELTVI